MNSLTALLNNTRTLKYKTQPTYSFFTTENIIADISGLRVVIGRCLSIVSVSGVRGPVFVTIIIIDGSAKRKY